MKDGGPISAMQSSIERNKIPKREKKLGHFKFRKSVPIGEPLIYKNKLSKAAFTELVEKLKAEKKTKTKMFIFLFLAVIPPISYFLFKYF